MSVRRNCLALLCLPALGHATTLAFIGPELAGVYQIRNGQAHGELVTLLNQLGKQAGIEWEYRHASPARVELTLQSQPKVCSLLLQGKRQGGNYQVMSGLGRHAIVAYSALHDTLTLSDLDNLPVSQRLGFGTGLKGLLLRQKRLNITEHPSLATAVQLVSLGRARVLLTTQIGMYSLQPTPLLRRVGTVVEADNVLACSSQLPPGVAQGLRKALRNWLIPFAL